MIIDLQNISKRYSTTWIFKNYSLQFGPKGKYGISGSNGSGKSTLLQLISGYLSPTKGTITYSLNNKNIERDNIYNYVSIAAPYMELLEELSLIEFFEFTSNFKPLIDNVNIENEIHEAGLWNDRHKYIKQFSSGMKQKTKLLSAILSKSSFVLLDEPTSFLDNRGKEWTYDLLDRFQNDHLFIIASNESEDLDKCDKIITI